MSIRRSALFVIAFAFALLLNAYFFMHMVWNRALFQQGKISKGDQCGDDVIGQTAPRTNPNKMLFISCGGFLE